MIFHEETREERKRKEKEIEKLKALTGEGDWVCAHVYERFLLYPELYLYGATMEGYVKAITDPKRTPGLSELERIIQYSGGKRTSHCLSCKCFRNSMCKAHGIKIENTKIQNFHMTCDRYIPKSIVKPKTEIIPGQMTLEMVG